MKFGFKKIEAIVTTLILTILVSFTYLVALSNPSIQGILGGYLPTPTSFETPLLGHESQLTLALGMWERQSCPIISIFIHPYPKQGKSITKIRRMFEKPSFYDLGFKSSVVLAFIVNSLLLIFRPLFFWSCI